jgi:hypothetical protein
MSGGKAVGMKDEFKSFAGVQAEHEGKGRPQQQQQQQATMPALAGGSIAGFLPSDLIAPANSPIGTTHPPQPPAIAHTHQRTHAHTHTVIYIILYSKITFLWVGDQE